MSTRVEPAERERIVDLLHEHGGNQNKVAKICGRSQSTVQKIATQEGITSINRAPKNANAARSLFAEVDRMTVIGEVISMGRVLLTKCRDAKDYKDIVTGLAIGIDKHRLETGEATSRSENVDPAEAARRQKVRESLDEVAAQRAKRVG